MSKSPRPPEILRRFFAASSDGDAPLERPAARRLPHAVPRLRPGSRRLREYHMATTCATSTERPPRGCTTPTCASTTRIARSRRVPARLEPLGVDFGSGEVRKRTVAADFVAVCWRAPHAPRQQCGRAVLRRGRRHHYPGAQRAAPRPEIRLRCSSAPAEAQPAHRHSARCSPARRTYEAALAGVRGVGLHQRAGLGSSASASSRQRHEIVACGCTIRWNSNLPDIGMLLVRTPRPERGVRRPNDRGFRKRFAAAAQRARGGPARGVPPGGIDAQSFPTERLLDAIRRFADMRKRRSGSLRGRRCPPISRSPDDLPVAGNALGPDRAADAARGVRHDLGARRSSR